MCRYVGVTRRGLELEGRLSVVLWKDEEGNGIDTLLELVGKGKVVENIVE